ncbi:MAG: ATP-binding protein [Cyclobacteriaceae bacterium]|nr:ATP-binding protein [Cyclobacteriaceae bacterium]
MHIKKLTVSNYKSFNSPATLELTIGINVITGQNSSGKTALLEALSTKFSDTPHRSTKSSRQAVKSDVTLNIELSKEELLDLIPNNLVFGLPKIRLLKDEQINYANFLNMYFEDKVSITASFNSGNIVSSKFNIIREIIPSSHSKFKIDHIQKQIIDVTLNHTGGDSSNFIASEFVRRIYIFKAERFKIGISNQGTSKVLRSDASNLPEVLNCLQSDSHRFNRFNSFLNRIFPHIHFITVRPTEGGQVEIVVWNEDPKKERNDLVVPLLECGTGISQVLAILYVVLTSDVPKTIIIDEPNSFLHPGAARKLIEILKEHKQHQIIISTHSPSTLTASNPETIHIVKLKDAESFVETVSLNDTKNQQLYLAEIGAKLSDVFGADNILWVEGKTEEICFPKIIDMTPSLTLRGTTILSVVNTGDFLNKRKKSVETIFKIYETLSKGKGLMPPSIGFIFDSEELKENEKDDLRKRSQNKVLFLPRRMFENYLINSNALLSVISSHEGLDELNLTLEDVDKWLKENKWNPKFIKKRFINTKSEPEWQVNVDGAKLLSDLFTAMTSSRLSFDKIKHSVALCDWLIENSLESFDEIKELLSAQLDQSLTS